MVEVFVLCDKQFRLTAGFAHLIIVVDKLHVEGTAIGGATTPVVTNVVEHIQLAGGITCAIQSASHTPVAAVAVDKQVMTECSHATSDGGGESMVFSITVFLMSCDAQCLRNHTVLESDVLGTTTGECLVSTPCRCGMVDDGVVVAAAHGVTCSSATTALEAHMATDDVRSQSDIRRLDADTFARCRLSGDVGIVLREARRETPCFIAGIVGCDNTVDVEFDGTAHVEDDIAGLVDIDESVEERAGSIGIATEVGDMIDDTSSSTDSIATVALSVREGQLSWTEAPYITFVYGAVRLHLVDTPVVGLHGVQSVFGIFRSSTLVFVLGRGSHCLRIGAQHEFMTGDAVGSLPREGYRSVVRSRMEILIGWLWVGGCDTGHIKFQTIQHHAGIGIGLAADGPGGIGDDHRLSFRCCKGDKRLSSLFCALCRGSHLLTGSHNHAVDADIDIRLYLIHVGVIVIGFQCVLASRQSSDGKN